MCVVQVRVCLALAFLVTPVAVAAPLDFEVEAIAWHAFGDLDFQVEVQALVRDWSLSGAPDVVRVDGEFTAHLYEVRRLEQAGLNGTSPVVVPVSENRIDTWRGRSVEVTDFGVRGAARWLAPGPHGSELSVTSNNLSLSQAPNIEALAADDVRGPWHATFDRPAWPESDVAILDGDLPTHANLPGLLYVYDATIIWGGGQLRVGPEPQSMPLTDGPLNVHRFAVLHFHDATVHEAHSLAWMASALAGRVNGTSVWYDPDGPLVVNGTTHPEGRSVMKAEGTVDTLATVSTDGVNWKATGNASYVEIDGVAVAGWKLSIGWQTIAAGASIVALAAALVSALKQVGGVALGRNRPSYLDPMGHTARRTIVERLGTQPDSTVAELRGALGLSRTATRFHLDVLVRAGVVRRGNASGKDLYRLADEPNSRPRELAHVSVDGMRRELIACLVDEVDGLRACDLRRAWPGKAPGPSLLAYHLKQLHEAGILKRRRQGRAAFWSLGDPNFAVELGLKPNPASVQQTFGGMETVHWGKSTTAGQEAAVAVDGV